MIRTGSLEEIRPTMSAEVAEISGGSIVAVANAVARMFRGWELIGCGADADGRNYCDYSIPKN